MWCRMIIFICLTTPKGYSIVHWDVFLSVMNALDLNTQWIRFLLAVLAYTYFTRFLSRRVRAGKSGRITLSFDHRSDLMMPPFIKMPRTFQFTASTKARIRTGLDFSTICFLTTVGSFCPCLYLSHWSFVSSFSDFVSWFFPLSLLFSPPSLSLLSSEEEEESAGQERSPPLQSRRRTSRLSRSPRVCSGWSEVSNRNFHLQQRWWRVGVRRALALLLSTPENLDEACRVWSDGSVSPCPCEGASPRPRGFGLVGWCSPAGSCDGTSHLKKKNKTKQAVRCVLFTE